MVRCPLGSKAWSHSGWINNDPFQIVLCIQVTGNLSYRCNWLIWYLNICNWMPNQVHQVIHVLDLKRITFVQLATYMWPFILMLWIVSPWCYSLGHRSMTDFSRVYSRWNAVWSIYNLTQALLFQNSLHCQSNWQCCRPIWASGAIWSTNQTITTEPCCSKLQNASQFCEILKFLLLSKAAAPHYMALHPGSMLSRIVVLASGSVNDLPHVPIQLQVTITAKTPASFLNKMLFWIGTNLLDATVHL